MRLLWIGIGGQRGIAYPLLASSLAQLLAHHQLALAAIAGLATLDRKAGEPALLALSAARGWPLRSFTAAELRAVASPHPSAAVMRHVGVPSVAEAAALRAAALAAPSAASGSHLLIPKQICRQPGTNQAIALAIASPNGSDCDARPGRRSI